MRFTEPTRRAHTGAARLPLSECQGRFPIRGLYSSTGNTTECTQTPILRTFIPTAQHLTRNRRVMAYQGGRNSCGCGAIAQPHPADRQLYSLAMATWTEFAAAAPDMAAAGRELWRRHVLMFMGTVRGDGSPRVHPVVPVLGLGRIFVAIAPRSPKWRDLQRDPRCVLHALPGERDDEFVLRCTADESAQARELVRSAANHLIHDDDRIFELGIEQADHGWWEHVGQPGTYQVRRRWTPASGLTDLATGRSDP